MFIIPNSGKIISVLYRIISLSNYTHEHNLFPTTIIRTQILHKNNMD